VVCLQSRSGGKVSNRTYTMRDPANGVPSFEVVEGNPLLAEEEVTLRFRVKGARE